MLSKLKEKREYGVVSSAPETPGIADYGKPAGL
jgi:hypothetical protein